MYLVATSCDVLAGPVAVNLLPMGTALYGCRAEPGRMRAVPTRHEAVLDPARTPTRDDAGALLRRCAQGDQAALRVLYETQGDRMYAIALRITRQQALAADAMHDAFINVWRRAAQFDPARGNAEAWLISIVRNRALDLARRGAREVTGLEMPDQEDESEDALSRLSRTAEAAALRRCLEELDEEKRRLVVMAFMDGSTHAELATRLGLPLGTVKSSIRRGLMGLRRCLES
jgi:RNA polymerase sigma-70 factor (ECF subfamily)